MSCLIMYVNSWISTGLSSNNDFLLATKMEKKRNLFTLKPHYKVAYSERGNAEYSLYLLHFGTSWNYQHRFYRSTYRYEIKTYVLLAFPAWRMYLLYHDLFFWKRQDEAVIHRSESDTFMVRGILIIITLPLLRWKNLKCEKI